jgi:hypothetical protein
MSQEYVTKPNSSAGYKIDRRATINEPLKPVSSDILGGPENIKTSGVNVSPDVVPGLPYGS